MGQQRVWSGAYVPGSGCICYSKQRDRIAVFRPLLHRALEVYEPYNQGNKHALPRLPFTCCFRQLAHWELSPGSCVPSCSTEMGILLLNMLRNTCSCVISNVLHLSCHHQQRRYVEKFLIVKARYPIPARYPLSCEQPWGNPQCCLQRICSPRWSLEFQQRREIWIVRMATGRSPLLLMWSCTQKQRPFRLGLSTHHAPHIAL